MTIKINNEELNTLEAVTIDDAEMVWQAMSEQFDLVPDGDEARLAEWQDLPDDDVPTMLAAAKEAGFISSYEIN